jgi:hypothetical protein
LEYGSTLTDGNVIEVSWNVPEGAFNSKADLLKEVKVLAIGQLSKERQEHATVVKTVTSRFRASRRKSSFSRGAWEHCRSCFGKPARRNPRPPAALASRILASHTARSQASPAPEPPHGAEVWIYRGDANPEIYRDVYRQTLTKSDNAWEARLSLATLPVEPAANPASGTARLPAVANRPQRLWK